MRAPRAGRRAERGAVLALTRPRRRPRRRGRAARLLALHDPVGAAEAAGLAYVSDGTAGIRRVRRGRGFSYVDPRGAPISDAETRARIRALAIPPAWEDVWIAPRANAHLLATGRDARGRKQYVYHPRWRAVREVAKFDRSRAFGEALPGIRARVDADLARRDLSRARVVAAVVRLLDRTLVRVGNDEYARANDTFGLTTLRTDHVDATERRVHLSFRGKSGKRHDVEVVDPRAARVVRRCQELPGQELFSYVDDDGEVRHVGSDDVNAYLREAGDGPFSAKDFRTWGASAAALGLLALREPPQSDRAAEAAIREVVKEVASVLGNTPAVCRASYIHPAVLDAYRGGRLPALDAPRPDGLARHEALLLALLEEAPADLPEPEPLEEPVPEPEG